MIVIHYNAHEYMKGYPNYADYFLEKLTKEGPMILNESITAKYGIIRNLAGIDECSQECPQSNVIDLGSITV